MAAAGSHVKTAGIYAVPAMRAAWYEKDMTPRDVADFVADLREAATLYAATDEAGAEAAAQTVLEFAEKLARYVAGGTA